MEFHSEYQLWVFCNDVICTH